MTDYPELGAPFNGRSYDEMIKTLKKTVFYPLLMCSACGRSYVDFDELETCPFCGGVRRGSYI